MAAKIRVALVDDHRVVRQGLRNYLESFSDIAVVGTASSGKEAEPEVLLDAGRAAARQQSLLDPAVAGPVMQELLRAGARDSLTEREREVLRQLALGRTNRQIADSLVTGEATVKTHVGNILAKLHLEHRTQAALYAIKRGLVSLDEVDVEPQTPTHPPTSERSRS